MVYVFQVAVKFVDKKKVLEWVKVINTYLYVFITPDKLRVSAKDCDLRRLNKNSSDASDWRNFR